MNTDVIKGKWLQIRGEIQNQWGKLTNDDVDQIEGNTDKLIGKLQERYGYARDRAQQEIDRLWKKLSDGGTPSQCGWLKDKFGLSWQIVPTGLPSMLADKDPAKAARVMRAMMKMGKLDIAELKLAYNNQNPSAEKPLSR